MPDKVTVNIDIASMKKVSQSLKNQVLIRQKCGKKIVSKYTLLIQADAKRSLRDDPRRIDDGILRNSIRILILGLAGRVFTENEYSTFVHWGTGIHGRNPKGGHRLTPWVYFDEKEQKFFVTTGMEPNMFLKNAYNDNVTGFLAEIKACFRKSDTSLA